MSQCESHTISLLQPVSLTCVLPLPTYLSGYLTLYLSPTHTLSTHLLTKGTYTYQPHFPGQSLSQALNYTQFALSPFHTLSSLSFCYHSLSLSFLFYLSLSCVHTFFVLTNPSIITHAFSFSPSFSHSLTSNFYLNARLLSFLSH